MALTKYDIIHQICNVLEFNKKQSTEAVEALLELIKASLESGKDLMISRFGKFYVKEKQERLGRNPATGDPIVLDSRRVVGFKCSRGLKAKINGRE